MDNMKNNSTYSAFGELLQILFIALKLIGIIKWSWFWVLSPIWISLSFVVIIVIVFFIFAMYKELIRHKP